MPKKIPEKEIEAIAAIVAVHPDGVQVRSIRDGLEFDWVQIDQNDAIATKDQQVIKDMC